MKFRYFKFPLKKPDPIFGKTILKPIIPVELSINEISLKYAALIDSGADFCIFDGEIGSILGLDIQSGIKMEFGGIQERGGAVAYIHPIQIKIGGWSRFIQAGFSYDIAKHGYGVLGQKGFFDNFVVKFDLLKEEIELRPTKI